MSESTHASPRTPSDRKTALFKMLGKSLGLAKDYRIDLSSSLKSLGLTSLGAIALQYQLCQQFNLIVPLESLLGDKPFAVVLEEIDNQRETVFGIGARDFS